MRNRNLSLEERTDDLLHQRQNYSFIMEDFLENHIKGELLAELNIFRQRIHSTCRSDITTENGNVITSNACKGKKNGTTNRYIWPTQSIPH